MVSFLLFSCISGACACPAPIAYSPVVGCAPLPPPPPPPPVPVVTGRLIPQALPGAPCEPGVECTGGSVCSMGICLCPPELVQEGTVCVSRTIYGIVPPPPPPPVFVPAPVYAAPVALPPPPPVAFAPPCPPQYAPYNGGCVRRKHARKEATSEEKPEEQ
uniref:EB domain-containing protein n=1 Tax=Panagrolaimus sp. PS1159 TaxID=55785 RepID=A0AC35GLU1_9BILA